MKDKVRNGKVLGTDKGLWGGVVRGGREAKPLQVAQSPPKRAGNSCHSLWNVRTPGARATSPSIPVSQWLVNDKTLITPLINRTIPPARPPPHTQRALCA